MNPSLKDFFNEEKKRVFTPDPFFHTRVLARLDEGQTTRDFSIWDVVPGSARPVLALALTMLLAFTAVQLFVPVTPEQGFLDALLESEQGSAEAVLYSGQERPADQDFLNQLLGIEDAR